MAAVSLDIIQTGSTSATLHVQPGDTITFELAETVFNNALAQAVASLNAALGSVTGAINFATSTSGGAS